MSRGTAPGSLSPETIKWLDELRAAELAEDLAVASGRSAGATHQGDPPMEPHIEPRLARGMRDLTADTLKRRRAVTDTLRGIFEAFGYVPLETPAVERLEVLDGSYGSEGEKLIFRILKRGRGAAQGEADLGLRYDLTVPLSRFVASNRSLPLPFKRYQIQKVWRADKPQRGRYREFEQCDIDTVGSSDPTADGETIALIARSLAAVGVHGAQVMLNHRGILQALVRDMRSEARFSDIALTLDKLDKIGPDGVSAELARKGVSEDAWARLWDRLREGESIGLAALGRRLDAEGTKAVSELERAIDAAQDFGTSPEALRFQPALARGLSYYTGPVFEAHIPGASVGAVAGGGRYDGLVSRFSDRSVPGVGVSLGLDRIVDVLAERGAFTAHSDRLTCFVGVHSEPFRRDAIRLAGVLRNEGLSTDLWLLPTGRLRNQIRFANHRAARFFLAVGPRERDAGTASVRDLDSGEEWSLDREAVADFVRAR